MDHCIRTFLDEVSRLGHDEDIVVFITADHGELLGEHGKVGHTPDLYEEGLKIPLIILEPEVDGVRVKEPVSLLDVGPTILDYAGAEKPITFQGQSLIPLIYARGRYESRPIISVSRTGKRILRIAVRKGNYKLIIDVRTGERFLHDLARDPGESVNLAGVRSDVVERLEQELHELLAKLRRASEGAVRKEAVRVKAARIRERIRRVKHREARGRPEKGGHAR